jgi:hypothetical protein
VITKEELYALPLEQKIPHCRRMGKSYSLVHTMYKSIGNDEVHEIAVIEPVSGKTAWHICLEDFEEENKQRRMWFHRAYWWLHGETSSLENVARHMGVTLLRYQPKRTLFHSMAQHALDRRIWLWAERILDDIEGQLFTSNVVDRFREDAINEFEQGLEFANADAADEAHDRIWDSPYASPDEVYIRITISDKEFYMLSRYQGELGRGVRINHVSQFFEIPSIYICIKESATDYRVRQVGEDDKPISDPFLFYTPRPNGVLHRYTGERP